jgi:hypothetical protein
VVCSHQARAFEVEAHHLEVLNFNFRGWAQVNFPRPFYASSAMIIETFEPGRIATSVLDAYDDVAETLNKNDTIGILIGNMIVEEADDVGDTHDNSRRRARPLSRDPTSFRHSLQTASSQWHFIQDAARTTVHRPIQAISC